MPGLPSGCPLGDAIVVDGVERTWGDFDCSGTFDANDATFILADLAGAPIAPAANCPGLRDPVPVGT